HAHVDSGPKVRMGELRVEGLQRVPRSLIRRYVVYSRGEAYDQDKLDTWQQELEATSFFRGASVMLDSEPEHRVVGADGEVEMPVQVRVTESPPRRLSTSLGVDSDNGVRVEGLY